MKNQDIVTKFFVFFVFYSFSLKGISHSLFDVDKMLSKNEIDRILIEKDFFGKKRYQDHGSPIEIKDLTYSKFFYEERTQGISYEQTLDLALKRSLLLRLSQQNYKQARYDQHIAIGNLLPSMQLVAGESLPINPKTLFTGFFSFLLPHQWIKLGQSRVRYKIAKLILLKNALDANLDAKLTYLEAHRMVLEFEILSFFYVHFRLMERFRLAQGTHAKDLSFLRMATYSMSLRMGALASGIELKLNDLARSIQQITDEMNQYRSDLIRIEVLSDFMDFVAELEDFGEQYSCQENFIKKALEHSVEIITIQKLAKIAKMNIGVIAIGDFLNITQDPMISPNLGINLGYSNIPRILKSNADKKIATINVYNEVLKFVDQARFFYTGYVNASRIYKESMRSLIYSRENFYRLLDPVIEDKTLPVDGQLLFASVYIVESEITHNKGLHDALKAKAQMSRLLLEDKIKVQNYLPSSIDIDNIITNIHAGEEKNENKKAYLHYLKHLHRVDELKDFLSGKGLFPEDMEEKNKASVVKIVEENIRQLLYPKKRSRKFFRTLQKFVTKHQIKLTTLQQDELNHYQVYSKFTRIFRHAKWPIYNQLGPSVKS